MAEISKVDAKVGTTQLGDGERLIEQLKERLIGTENLTEVEKLEAQFANERYSKASAGERDIALGIASQIDARKELMTQLDAELAMVKNLTAEYSAQDSRLKSLISGTDRGQQTQKMMDEALAESALRDGKIDTTTYDQIIEKLGEVKDTGKDTFKELQDAIDGWGKQSADAIAEFCISGKLSFSDMAQSIIKDMMTMMIKKSITAPLAEGLSGVFGSLFGGLFGGGAGAASSAGFLGNGITLNANGGVFDSPSLSAYSGQIVSKPTMFAFAKGAGLMGEAGPEAILPLSRGSDGKLGVKGGGSGDVQVNITINSTDGNSQTDSKGDAKDGWTHFAQRIKGMILDEMTTQKRPGGVLYQ